MLEKYNPSDARMIVEDVFILDARLSDDDAQQIAQYITIIAHREREARAVALRGYRLLVAHFAVSWSIIVALVVRWLV